MRERDDAALRAFGQRVRALRRSRGMTQQALSAASGLDRGYIAGIEAGMRNASILAVLALARGLRVNPSRLFTDD